MIASSITAQVGAFETVVAISVFILTFAFIVTEKFHSAIISSVGGFTLIAFRIVNQSDVIGFIEFDTIGLLCGMMMTVAVMRKTGIFEYIAIKGIKLTKGNPWKILVVLSSVTAILSAILDNVTTVLIIIPLTFAIADNIKVNPMPMLISEVIFSNIGGAATLIGDPPNILIGGASHLTFVDFIYINLPIVLIISVITMYLLKLIYHKKLMSVSVDKEKIKTFDESRAIGNKKFFITTLVVFTLIIAAFVTHHFHEISMASIAIGGGFIMLLVTKQDPEEVLKHVEWATLFFFIGLFIVIGGLEKTGVISHISDQITVITKGDVGFTTQLILWLSGLSTTFINSIPYTVTMISIIKEISVTMSGSTDQLWWALSLGACLGGNGSLIGAAANIVAAGFSQKTDYPMKFFEYVKVAFPLTIISLILSSIYLYLIFPN